MQMDSGGHPTWKDWWETGSYWLKDSTFLWCLLLFYWRKALLSKKAFSVRAFWLVRKSPGVTDVMTVLFKCPRKHDSSEPPCTSPGLWCSCSLMEFTHHVFSYRDMSKCLSNPNLKKDTEICKFFPLFLLLIISSSSRQFHADGVFK